MPVRAMAYELVWVNASSLFVCPSRLNPDVSHLSCGRLINRILFLFFRSYCSLPTFTAKKQPFARYTGIPSVLRKIYPLGTM